MRERPINLRAHEVRGILDGRVTQVRRPVKPQFPASAVSVAPFGDEWLYRDETGAAFGDVKRRNRCPFGTPGDRLWARERALCWFGGAGGTSDVVYFDDPEVPGLLRDRESIAQASVRGVGNWRWNPSIYMPRWASRITLEITDVRVQRVQDATDEDIRAEGTDEWVKAGGVVYAPRDGFDGQSADDSDRIVAKPNRVVFASMWNELHGRTDLDWYRNPWTWVVSFDVAEVRR